MLSLEHFEKISLDGKWKFQDLDHPSYDARRRWSSLLVPGFMPTIIQSLPDFPHLPILNPTGIYERDFDISPAWNKRRIVLHLGSCQTLGIISINGEEVGMTKDSQIASEFDITNFVQRGKNTIQIRVIKFSDANYLEDESNWRLGGLPRSIKIFVTNDVFIEQFNTTADLEEDSTTGTLQIEATVASLSKKDLSGYQLHLSFPDLLKEKGSNVLATLKGGEGGNLTIKTSLTQIKPWSSESPHLYSVDIELLDPQGAIIEATHQKIGFRHVELDESQIYINDKLVDLFYDQESRINLEAGEVLSRDAIRNNILDLKRRCYNSVFTGDYANDPALLDVCDELGIYAFAEPNIGDSGLNGPAAASASYLNAFMQSAARLINRDRHHPSVIVWSVRKAQSRKSNVVTMASFIQENDPSRPLDYDRSIKKLFAPSSAPRVPISIASKSPATGNFLLTNNQYFSDLSQFVVTWSITLNDLVLERGNLSLPVIRPRNSQKVIIKSKNLGIKKGKVRVTFSVAQINSTAWAPSHTEILSVDFVLPAKR